MRGPPIYSMRMREGVHTLAPPRVQFLRWLIKEECKLEAMLGRAGVRKRLKTRKSPRRFARAILPLLKVWCRENLDRAGAHCVFVCFSAVADAIRTSLGPRGMDKMIQSSSGDVTITNDGATILKQMSVLHPVARMVGDPLPNLFLVDYYCTLPSLWSCLKLRILKLEMAQLL